MDSLLKQVSSQQYKFAEIKNKLDLLLAEEEKIDVDKNSCDAKTLALKKELQELTVNIPKMLSRVKMAKKQLLEEQTSRSSLQMTLKSVDEKTQILEKSVTDTKQKFALNLKQTEERFKTNIRDNFEKQEFLISLSEVLKDVDQGALLP